MSVNGTGNETGTNLVRDRIAMMATEAEMRGVNVIGIGLVVIVTATATVTTTVTAAILVTGLAVL
ncbi:hypothetical protein OFC03_28105, partial [Escherichia coli]|nr:hypothetical protein [Escherichia coli]